MLKDNSKILLCSITPERDFYAQGQLRETSFAQSLLKETWEGGLLPYVLKNCSQVQSLSEFRVLVQRINVREQRKKEHKQLYRFLQQTESSPVPLALPRRVPLKCNVRLQVAQSHKKETSQCSRTTPRDFYAQSHLKETSMHKDNSKRLPLLNHY